MAKFLAKIAYKKYVKRHEKVCLLVNNNQKAYLTPRLSKLFMIEINQNIISKLTDIVGDRLSL